MADTRLERLFDQDDDEDLIGEAAVPVREDSVELSAAVAEIFPNGKIEEEQDLIG